MDPQSAPRGTRKTKRVRPNEEDYEEMDCEECSGEEEDEEGE